MDESTCLDDHQNFYERLLLAIQPSRHTNNRLFVGGWTRNKYILSYKWILWECVVLTWNDIDVSIFPSQTNYMSRMTKPTKWPVRPPKTQISLGICQVWSESSLCAQWVAKNPSLLHADSEDWSDWAHMPFVGFVVLWLNYVFHKGTKCRNCSFAIFCRRNEKKKKKSCDMLNLLWLFLLFSKWASSRRLW